MVDTQIVNVFFFIAIYKNSTCRSSMYIQYIPRNMPTVFALLCFVVVIHWLIFPYPSDLLHWHCGNLTIAPAPAKQPWWIWINTSSEFIMNDCITTTKQSTTKPCAYFLGYTVRDSSFAIFAPTDVVAPRWWRHSKYQAWSSHSCYHEGNVACYCLGTDYLFCSLILLLWRLVLIETNAHMAQIMLLGAREFTLHNDYYFVEYIVRL